MDHQADDDLCEDIVARKGIPKCIVRKMLSELREAESRYSALGEYSPSHATRDDIERRSAAYSRVEKLRSQLWDLNVPFGN